MNCMFIVWGSDWRCLFWKWLSSHHPKKHISESRPSDVSGLIPTYNILQTNTFSTVCLPVCKSHVGHAIQTSFNKSIFCASLSLVNLFIREHFLGNELIIRSTWDCKYPHESEYFYLETWSKRKKKKKPGWLFYHNIYFPFLFYYFRSIELNHKSIVNVKLALC